MPALDAIWRQAADTSQRDLVVVDEAWLLMQHPAGASWLYRMAKAADRGEGLLAGGRNRTAFHALASPAEHELITTDPEFLAKLAAEERNSGVDAP